MTLQDYRWSVDQALAKRETARQRHRQEKGLLKAALEDQKAAKEALSVAQGVAKAVQETAHRRVADVVGRSLQAVFDEPYEFKILFEQKRGRTEASLVFEREGLQVDPMTASGGGVVDVASLSLRLSCLILSEPPVRRLIILDEPARFVSSQYRSRVRALIEMLAKEMSCQFLIVTHIDEMKMGKVVEL